MHFFYNLETKNQNLVFIFSFNPGVFSVTKIVFFSILLGGIIPVLAQENQPEEKQVSHIFYLTGNTGLSKKNVSSAILKKIVQSSKNEESYSLLLTGNYTGNPKDREINKTFLKTNLLSPLEEFNGQIILVPGVREWKKGNQQLLDDLENFLQESGKKLYVWPDDGCPLESEEINDHVVLITVDSQWYLENWDDYPNMNSDCEIKTREQFFVEFKDELKDNHGKTKIVAIHHPVISNTSLGYINRIGGFTLQAYQNEEQRFFRGRLETLAKQFDDVIFISGNDRNLQFLMDDNLPQIISGAAAETQPAKAREDSDFASEKNGYAKLVIYENGSSKVYFYEVTGESENLLFSRDIRRDRPGLDEISYPPRKEYGETTTASIYTKEETDKGPLYRWLWGENYRQLYSRKIEVPNLYIEDLPGNLKPLKEAGGQQSRSLRFIDDNLNEYTLRELRKSAIRFLQANAVKDHYIEEYLQNTVAQRYVLDFFTSAHPYAPFTINDLSKALDIYHANPEIYYVPKQKGLGIHNDDYGDELYMFEEHVGDENKEFKNFGSPDDILSTTDLLLEIKESEKSFVDESSYIKARLFDMLIGDWDRHEDQWRWAEFQKENDIKVYEPIPRDRDLAFSKYDGPMISLLKAAFPVLRKMQSYDEEISNIKWFNYSGYPLDKVLIKTAKWEDWEKQVSFIRENLTNKEIDKAFAALPEDVQEESLDHIKSTLKIRRDHLLKTARKYYDYLLNFDVITGTTKNDLFLIRRTENGNTAIEISRENNTYFRRTYNSAETGEIWIYGLDGEDIFKLEGAGERPVQLKIIGGEGHDLYDFENTRNAKIYDHKSRENTILNKNTNKWLVDSYDINTYDYEKRKYYRNRILPSVGFEPDRGLSLGLKDVLTTYGLVRNIFTSRHEIDASYYFATNGLEISYLGEYAHIFYNWNLGLVSRFTDPNFTLNYFGQGNETNYQRDKVKRDYNRVRMQHWLISPSLIWRNNRGSSFTFKGLAEAIKVYRDEHRVVGQVFPAESAVFERQYYAGAEAGFHYLNKTNPPYPTRGMELDVISGFKSNIDDNNNQFGYLKPVLSIDYPLHHTGAVVLATRIGGEVIIGKNYEFYHGATIGGNHNLRGYRNERFNGNSTFYQSTDLRIAFTRFRTNFVPVMMGVTAGFDYGRVWAQEEPSSRWHNNYGGSFWINGFDALTGNIGLYHGREGNRLVFTLGFHF